ncbi:MAG: CsgG/HfaB family protein [Myxococcota bacterium]
MGWLLGLLALPAFGGRTVAVLPLEPGARSEAYEGLGLALSGMIVSDLARVEELELVERSRLDAVLSELELGRSGFVDPATAAQLGKGVGAEWVVVGSWSVVKERFVMDARAVSVGSGKVVAAADATGGIDDFVTVEKSLVEALLKRLKVAVTAGERRQILADAPTEDFAVVAEYGAGLQAELDGDYARARERFEAAAQQDPGFALAVERIRDLRERLEQDRATREDARKTAFDERFDAVFAKTPDEMGLTGRTDDPVALGTLALRFRMLTVRGKACQAAKEVRHFVDRHDGRFIEAEHPIPYNGVGQAAYDLGMYDGEPFITAHGTIAPPNNAFESVVFYASLSWPGQILAEAVQGLDDAKGHGGLVNLTIQCAGPLPQARRAALEDLQAFVAAEGLADVKEWRNGGLPMWAVIELLILESLAVTDGLTDEVVSRLERLSKLELSDDDAYSLKHDIERIPKVATAARTRRLVLDGLEPAEVLRIAAGEIHDDPAVIAVDRPRCQRGRRPWVQEQHDLLAKLLDDGEIDPRERSGLTRVTTNLVLPMRLLGCVVGEPAMFDGAPELVAWIDTLPSRARPDRGPKCDERIAELGPRFADLRTLPPEEAERRLLSTLEVVLSRTVADGCTTLR